MSEDMQCKADLHDELYRVQDMIRQIERLNQNCTDNMKRLNAMMLELKGIVAMVRPQVKKTGWYGDEISIQVENQVEKMNIPEFIDVRKIK